MKQEYSLEMNPSVKKELINLIIDPSAKRIKGNMCDEAFVEMGSRVRDIRKLLQKVCWDPPLNYCCIEMSNNESDKGNEKIVKIFDKLIKETGSLRRKLR